MFFVLTVLFFGVHLFASGSYGAGAPAAHMNGSILPSNVAHAAVFQEQPDGAQLYSVRCQTCHQADGGGVPGVFPPLDGSKWVVGDKGRLIRIILNGLMGEITVKGQTYGGSMPPWGTFLNDEQVAAIATYIRTSWSNDTTAVAAAEVAAVRSVVKDRMMPWTAEELKKEENTGIPETSGSSKSAQE